MKKVTIEIELYLYGELGMIARQKAISHYEINDMSFKEIEEQIKENGYYFFEDGKLANISQTLEQQQNGVMVLNFMGKKLMIGDE